MFDTMFVARKIREARSAQNMTQMQLADAMEVSYQAVSNWERGNSMPDISKLEVLCDVLHMSLEELLGTGKQTEAVKKSIQTEEDDGRNPMNLEELQGIAPLLPPEDLHQKLAEEINLEGASFEELSGLAPFLSKEALGKLVNRMLQQGVSLRMENIGSLGPFLDKEILGAMIDRVLEKDDSIDVELVRYAAPFLNREKLNEIARRQVDNGNWKLGDLHHLMPFM